MELIKFQYLFMHNKNSKKSSNIWELPQPDKGYTPKPTSHHLLYTNILDIFFQIRNYSSTYMWILKNKLIKKIRIVVTRDRGWEEWGLEDSGQKVQMCIYKMNKY